MQSAGVVPVAEGPAARFARIVDDLQLEPGPVSVTTELADGDREVYERDLAVAIAAGLIASATLTPTNNAHYSTANGRADVDISGADFDFVRSIEVFDIDWHQWDHESAGGDHSCKGFKRRARLGSYGPQGDFAWRDVTPEAATSQPWLGFTTIQNESCTHEGKFRGIGVQWRSYGGNHGYEVVEY